MSGSFHLNAESLCSKWGFGDGDALDEWWWETYDEAPPFNTDDMLHALVIEHLVPEMRKAGWDPMIVRISTVHNPIRAEHLNGVTVDWYDSNVEFDPPIEVWVTPEQVEQMAHAIRPRDTPVDKGQ